MLRDAAQRLGQRRLTEDVARLRRRAVRQERVRAVLAQLRLQPLPVPRHIRVHRPAIGGVADRRLQQLVEALAAMRLQQRLPGVDRARHGDGMRRGVLQRRDAVLFVPVDRGGGRCAAGAIQREHLAGAGRRIQAEAVAADAGRLRLDHAQHGGCRHRGVQRIAAGAQHIERGQRGGRHRGGGHAVRRIDRAAAGEVVIAHRSVRSSGCHGPGPVVTDRQVRQYGPPTDH